MHTNKHLALFSTLTVMAALPLLTDDAVAGTCSGEVISLEDGFGISSCIDDETRAGAVASIEQVVAGEPDALLVAISHTETETLSGWTVTGFTFDVDGQVIDGCTFTLRPPEDFKLQFGVEACHDAVSVFATGDFSQ